MEVVLPVSREVVTPNMIRTSVLKIKYIETNIGINVHKHYDVGKPDDYQGLFDIIWLLEGN